MSSRGKRTVAQRLPGNTVKSSETRSLVASAQNWSGPLPPPEALACFDEIIENGADRIMRMSEQEQHHRIEIERLTLQANIVSSEDFRRTSFVGLLLGASVSLAAIIAAVSSVISGAHPSVSIALVGVPILGMVKALVGDKKEKDSKQ